MPISVAVVEDHPDYRAATAYVLKASPTCTCVGEFSSAEDLIANFEKVSPEVVLMDIGLPGMSGTEATAVLKRDYPKTEIIMLSVYEDDDKVFQAICSGASGYVTKPVMPQQLLEAVEHAFSGGTPMSPNIARKVLNLFKQHVPPPRAHHELTKREEEVLQMLVQGADYKAIAEKLFLSLYTVRAHIRNIYEKLHVHSKSQAVAKALREKVI